MKTNSQITPQLALFHFAYELEFIVMAYFTGHIQIKSHFCAQMAIDFYLLLQSRSNKVLPSTVTPVNLL